MKKIKLFSFLLIIVTTVFFGTGVLAQNYTPGDDTVKLSNPLGDAVGSTDFRVIAGKGIQAALGLLGSLALAMFVFGGFLWLTSGGNDDRIKQGTKTMIWAAAGIFLVLTSYAVLTFIFQGITGFQNFDITTVEPVSAPPGTVKTGCWCFVNGVEQSVTDPSYDSLGACTAASGAEDPALGQLTNCVYHGKDLQ